jgi:hypothetical protein
MELGKALSYPTFDEAVACTQLVRRWLLGLILRQLMMAALLQSESP